MFNQVRFLNERFSKQDYKQMCYQTINTYFDMPACTLRQLYLHTPTVVAQVLTVIVRDTCVYLRLSISRYRQKRAIIKYNLSIIGRVITFCAVRLFKAILNRRKSSRSKIVGISLKKTHCELAKSLGTCNMLAGARVHEHW